MVEISEIVGRENLRKWLEALPFDEGESRRIAATIDHRTVMRVLPVYWDWVYQSKHARENNLTPLVILRVSLTAAVAGARPTRVIRKAVTAATGVARLQAKGNMAIATDNIAEAVLSAATDAAEAVAADFSVPSYSAAGYANAHETVYASAMWESIRMDCSTLEKGKARLGQAPLWSDENPLMEMWMQVRQDFPKGFDFWRDWYQDALDGVKPNWDMLTEIALIDPEDWDKGAEHVNGLIAEIQLKYAVAASPNAEDLIVNDDGLYEVIPRSDLPARTLQDVQDRLRDVISDIRRAQQQENNQYNPLVAEADLLESTLARYSENPLRLFESCTKVVIHIGRNVANGVLPENDNLVGDVSGDVQNSADDILNLDAEVRETIEARGKLRFERLSDEQKEEIARIAEAAAQNSVDELAEELREDSAATESELEPSEETRPNRYRLGSRLARIVVWAIAGTGGTVAFLAALEPAYATALKIWKVIAPLLGF